VVRFKPSSPNAYRSCSFVTAACVQRVCAARADMAAPHGSLCRVFECSWTRRWVFARVAARALPLAAAVIAAARPSSFNTIAKSTLRGCMRAYFQTPCSPAFQTFIAFTVRKTLGMGFQATPHTSPGSPTCAVRLAHRSQQFVMPAFSLHPLHANAAVQHRPHLMLETSPQGSRMQTLALGARLMLRSQTAARIIICLRCT
jgi:hypothetical protein